MRLTTYHQNGIGKEIKDLSLQVPEYVKVYDDGHSFLNITEDELEAVNSRTNSFRKQRIIHQLSAAIKHDYANYEKAYKNKEKDTVIGIDEYIHLAESTPRILNGDKIMASIMRIYKNRPHENNKIPAKEEDFLEQTCTKEEFLAYANDELYQPIDECRIINTSIWFNVILYHALKSTYNNGYESPNINHRFYVCFQNLINRYYYSLRNMSDFIWMPEGLKQLKDALGVFTKRADGNFPNWSGFQEPLVVKLINALYCSHEQHRSFLYMMTDFVLGRGPSIDFCDKTILQMCLKNLPKYEVKKHDITFFDYNKKPYACYEIDDNDICSLRIPGFNNDVIEDHINVYETLNKVLRELYSEYVQVKRHNWSGSVEIDAKIYFSKNKSPYENWTDFFFYEIEKYKYGLLESDLLKPQRSFYHLVCDNIRIDEVIGFSNEIVAGLLDIMIEYPDDNQEGLYECIYRMNYIKNRETRDVTKVAFEKAMKYIGRLFEEDCNVVVPYFKPSLKQLMSQILSLKSIRGKLVKPSPTKNFKGGFNLSLVYNVLGLLRKASILHGGAEAIDIQIREYAYNNGLIDKKKERKCFIYETTEINEELDTIKAIIQLYLNKL